MTRQSTPGVDPWTIGDHAATPKPAREGANLLTGPAPRPNVARLAAYALADLSLTPGKRPVQLAQNESAFPPSPSTFATVEGAQLYPDADWTNLRTAIAGVHGIDPALLLCGSGSMELIGALIRAYAGPGDEVLAPQHAYGFFRTATTIAGAAYVTAPEVDLNASVDALIAGVTDLTRVVCIANPANPTGTWLPADEIHRLRTELPCHIVLLLDEAYGEFAPGPALQDELVDHGNTVISRTFSKAYCLAGMRVGWAMMPPAIGLEVRKLLNPNNVSTAAQSAATAAIRDQTYMRDTVRRIAASRERFAARLDAMGLGTTTSHANFVLIRFADADEAARADRALRSEGIVVRTQSGHGLPECLRVTIGTDAEMDLTAETLRDWIEGGRP